MICGVLGSANNLDRHSRSFQMLLSENKCSVLFRSLLEFSGNLTTSNIADDLA